MDKVITSPLMYPGGKRWLYKTLLGYIPKRAKEIVTPFMGGGAVELNLSARGVKVYGYDICPHLANFWQHWIHHQHTLQKDAETLLEGRSCDDLVIEKQRRFLSGSDGEYDPYMQAAWYCLFNRLSLQGLVFEKYLIPTVKRDGIYLRQKLRTNGRQDKIFPQYDRRRDYALSVSQSSFETTLARHPNTFAYCDPPYVNTANVYKDGADFDHYLLSETLKSRDNWILSYSDSDLIRQLYQDYKMLELVKTSGFRKAGKGKKQHELLIFSHDIAAEIKPQYKQLYLF